MSWTTPDELRAQVQRHWDRGRILQARARRLLASKEEEPLFPLALRLRKPDGRDLSDRFEEARRWIQALEAASGEGYEIEWEEINHRQLGKNRVPKAVRVASEREALRMIRAQSAAERFDALIEATRAQLPELLEWMANKPMRALEHESEWKLLLAIVTWIRAHPTSELYLRQLDIPGVHTKLMEARRGILDELLLELRLGREGFEDFEERYGFRRRPVMVRLRILDERLRIAGLSDITTPIGELARSELRARRVFITENAVNGLAFPPVDEGLVIFGLGYGLERLADVPWLRSSSLHYWGDIDTHGLAILDRLRELFPDARSLLMDRATLIEHRELWGEERSKHIAPLKRLTLEERALFDDLCSDRLGRNVRLEQERVSFGWLERALAAL